MNLWGWGMGICQPWGSLLGDRAVSFYWGTSWYILFFLPWADQVHQRSLFLLCCLEGKIPGCQCSEIPVRGETWGIWTSKLLELLYFHHCMPIESEDHPLTCFRQVSARMEEFSCPAVQRASGGLTACQTDFQPILFSPFYLCLQRYLGCRLLISLWGFCGTIWNILTADRILSFLVSLVNCHLFRGLQLPKFCSFLSFFFFLAAWLVGS